MAKQLLGLPVNKERMEEGGDIRPQFTALMLQVGEPGEPAGREP